MVLPERANRSLGVNWGNASFPEIVSRLGITAPPEVKTALCAGGRKKKAPRRPDK